MKWPSDTHRTPDGPGAKPFLAHLEDLRQTLIRCVVALAVGMALRFR